MSKIAKEIGKSLKTGQVKTNKKVANKQINAITQGAEQYIGELQKLNDQQNQQLTESTEQSILGTRQQVQKQYDYNAINQQVQQDQIAERMADRGLSNSGLNFSQQTALSTARTNADNSVMQHYNNAVMTLRSNLQKAINDNNNAFAQQVAGINYEMGNKITGIKTQLAKDNAEATMNFKTNVKSATNELISKVTSTSDKGANAQTIFSAANVYGLSESSVKKLLKMANISWKDYNKWLKNRDYFTPPEKKTVNSKNSSGKGSGKVSKNPTVDDKPKDNKKNDKKNDDFSDFENGTAKTSKNFNNALKTVTLQFRGSAGDNIKEQGVKDWFKTKITDVYDGLTDRELRYLRYKVTSKYNVTK